MTVLAPKPARNGEQACASKPPAHPGERDGLAPFFERTTRPKPRGSRFFRNLSTVTLAAIFSRLAALASFGYAARVLGPHQLGTVAYATSLTAYAGVFLLPGLVTWGTRQIAREPGRLGEIVGLVRALQLTLALFSYAALAAYAWLAVQDVFVRKVILASGLNLFVSALTLDWAFMGRESMGVPAALQVVTALATLGGLIVFVHSPADTVSYALVGQAALLLSIAISYAVLLWAVRVRPIFPGAANLREGLSASIGLGITMALVVVLHYANNLIVARYLGSEPLGLFYSAFRIFEICGLLPGLLAMAFQPRLARLAVGSHERACTEAALFGKSHVILGMGIAGCIFIEAGSVISVAFGDQYRGAVPVLRLMCIGILFNYAVYGYTNCLVAFGKDRIMRRVVLVGAVLSIGGGLLLVPRFGLIGAAATIACIDLGAWAASLAPYRRTIGAVHAGTWLRLGVGTGLAAGFVFVLRSYGAPLWLRIPAYIAIYAPFMLKEITLSYGGLTAPRVCRFGDT
jgi:O-antigen/teichoic acid export membrane protein